MPGEPQVPTTPLQTQMGSGWYDPPGGDIELDSLFPEPGQPQAAPATPAPPAPQAPAEPQSFLKTSTGTVYMNPEDAVKGIEEKDRVINELRSKLKATEGSDPLKHQPVSQEPRSYAEQPERVFDDLVDAANRGDKRKYAETLTRYNMEMLAPYAGLLSDVARERAIREAESQTHGVREFVGSPDFAAYVDSRPVLKQAIDFALSNPQASGQATELLQLAYEASLGRRAPELIRTAAAQTPVVPQNPRPTMTSSTPTMTPGQNPSSRPNMYTSDGRKAIIEAGKSKGLDGASWSEIGL